ncbi:hypothetical protein LPJ66_004563 [Kickxella alabastrina]|uniref:Uncharacterized protein n=1 Tax=Kickxella alabastrina TaxID=61397 RepID=A0ACC1IMK1_9FUNG|nr:hypothetical protein LPJ66_004563 [Kickxella alabastrina]
MKVVRKIFDTSRKGQKIVTNIYSPPAASSSVTKAGSKRLTLLITHANGFHKEIWEPTLKRLFSHQSDKWHIDKAVAMDAYNHGDSAVINRPNIFNEELSSWFENSRDILAVIRQLQEQKECASGAQSIIGIGHSWGASSLLLAEITSPLTFAALVLTDPVLHETMKSEDGFIKTTKKRRWQWDDEKAAQAYFEGHPFFKNWDKRCLDLHIKHGLEEVGGKLVLKCRPTNEAAVFLGATYSSSYATQNLWRVRCPTAFLTGETSLPGPPEYIRAIAQQMPDGCHEVMNGVGHLVVHEDPDRTADNVIRFFDGFAPKINNRAEAAESVQFAAAARAKL